MELPAFSEFFAAYEVKVEVGDFLSAIFTGIDKNSIAGIGNTELASQFLHNLENFTNEWLVIGFHFISGFNMFSGDNQNMHGCHRVDVFESYKVLIFKNEISGNFSPDNFTEYTFHSLLLFPGMLPASSVFVNVGRWQLVIIPLWLI